MSWMKSFSGWVDSRLPGLKGQWNYHMAQYYAPKNFNFWYFFGVLSLLVLVIQLGTGVWLLMSYEASAERAFASVEYIMRDVEMGWILRYMHSTGASAFFIVVYMHMFRGLLYGSYRAPRELVWVFGMAIYVVLMAEAFLGYVLPWGQMSYWGAQVIISLFGAIPYVGDAIVEWIRGDYLISGITLNRFMSLHVVAMPIVLLALVVIHVLALHEVGSNNPDGIEIKKNKDENGVPKDGIPFYPYYLPIHDLKAIVVFLFAFCAIMFFAPEMGGYFLEYANFQEANPLQTPAHIAPVWYFTPFYSMLRAVPDKLMGFITMAAAIAILFALPWLDRSPVKSIRYKGKVWISMILLFCASFIILGVLGVKAPTPARTFLAQICTAFYFLFFVGMPWWSKRDTFKEPPERVTMQGLGFGPFFKGLIVVLILSAVPLIAVGAESEYHCGTIECEHIELDATDQASLQRGAKWYMNFCYGCHATQYARYGRVATDLGIPESVMMDNLVFGDQKIGELMEISMTEEDAKAWFGVPPPDLTLVSRARSPEWVYTYLKNFYADDSRPMGVNNKVFPNVGMPHVLLELQGLQECAPGPVYAENDGIKQDPLTGEPLLEDPCGNYEITQAGSMSPEEFDQVAYDITNFLGYMAEPFAEQRRQLGVSVLLFLAFFFVLVWLLDREYWRKIH
jgi:ubiquinol-cytochrome c reductase cytochrome b subunit